MKIKSLRVFLIVTVIGLSVSAHATLMDMGDGTIYDTDTQLSWLKDANYAYTSGYSTIFGGQMSWDQANEWAAGLNAGSGFAGLTGWRLSTSDNCSGYNCTNNEMGHLFYTELGNKGYCDVSGNCPQPGWGLINTGPFTNLNLGSYWSGTEYEPNPTRAWVFTFDNGGWNLNVKVSNNSSHLWAVTDIRRDVATVPEPSTILLLGAGLAGVGLMRRRFKK